MKKRIISVVLCMTLLLTVFMSAPITVSAYYNEYDFEVDGVLYAQIDDSNVEIVEYNPDTLPEDVVIPSIVQGKTVTGVRFPGFGDAKIKSIELPDTVTKLDYYAFSQCFSLEKVTILGEVTSIDKFTFWDCYKLKEVNLPDSVEHIAEQAFCDCKSLESIDLPANLQSIDSKVFDGCISLKQVTINPALQTIGSSAFANLPALTDVIIEERSTKLSIGHSAFINCTSLKNFDFSYDLSISISAFKNCTSLTSVIMPEDANSSIDSSSFDGCTSLKKVKLADTITRIPHDCFSGCISLESIETAPLVEVAYMAFYDCELLTEISLHNAEYIQERAFKNCYSLSRVAFGENLKEIGKSAFENCYSLSSVTFKEGLKTIEERAFFNCFSLYEIYIPKTVELIGSMALGCFEEEGQYYIYTDFTVLGDPESLAPKYAEAYEMQYALPDVQLSSISNTADGIKLTFEKLSGVSGQYRIYRKTADTSWTSIANITSNTYTDKTAVSGVYYTYTVKFIGYDGTESRYDKIGLSTTRLTVPSVTKIQNTEKGVKLTIEKVEGASYYRVYYKTSDGWKGIDNTDTTTFVHESAQSGQSYTYTVKAFDKFENSSSFNSNGWSNTFIATPQITSVTSTEKGVKITWDKIDGAVNYRVYYKNGSDWKGIGNTTSTTFTHTDATPGVKYTYTVRCMKSDGKTAVSDYSKQGKSHTYFYRGSMASMHKAMQKIKSNNSAAEPAQKSSSTLKPQAIKSELVATVKQATQQLYSKLRDFAKR